MSTLSYEPIGGPLAYWHIVVVYHHLPTQTREKELEASGPHPIWKAQGNFARFEYRDRNTFTLHAFNWGKVIRLECSPKDAEGKRADPATIPDEQKLSLEEARQEARDKQKGGYA